MSEPKKETVRIVLPPRREGQTLASTPRETAMINLPPKPVPAAPGAPTPPSAPPTPPSAPSIPAAPAGLTPPSAPGIPKPPSFPGAAVPPSAPAVPKPVSAPPSVAKAPGAPTVPLRMPPSAGASPAAVRPEAKKETAKIGSNSGTAVKPQATVKLQPRPQPSQVASASFTAKSAQIVPADAAVLTQEEEIPMNLAIIALVAAVIAFALQLFVMLS